MSIRTMTRPAAMLGCAVLIAMAPARADELSELDQLSSATDKVDQGMVLARDQIGHGQLLDAAATLQRLMIVHPEALPAQLLHASLLCRLDDRTGAAVEFEALRRKDFKDQDWNEAMAPCSGTPGGA
ncbi:hypothetical protein [Novosphingobium sp.]|uniref:hypothetical protein n=1 Tax=Novosphingobium sp. TaxID=1874826 RepID=UPI003BADB800